MSPSTLVPVRPTTHRFLTGALLATLALGAAPQARAQTTGAEGPPDSTFAASGATLLAYFPFDGSADETARGLESDFYQLWADRGHEWFGEGRYGQAIQFLEVPPQVLVPLDIDFGTHPRITVSLWARELDESCDTRGVVLSTGRGADRAAGLTILNGDVFADAAGGRLFNYEQALVPGEWVNVVGVWDAPARRVRLHVDSTVAARTQIAGLDPVDIAANDRSQSLLKHPLEEERPPERYVVIGARNPDGNSSLCNVAIDDLRIYAGALTPDEIAAIRESDTPAPLGPVAPPPPPRAVADQEQETFPEEEDESSRPPPDGPSEDRGELVDWKLADEYELSRVSGSTASPRRGDLPDRKGIARISVEEQGDRPCRISIDAPGPGGIVEVAGQGPCDGRQRLYANIAFRLPGLIALTRLQVCQNRRSERVKGLRLTGRRIEMDRDAGEVRFREESADSDELNNCNEWADAVSCDDGQVASGVVAHFADAPRAGRDELVGLQLICREVVEVYR